MIWLNGGQNEEGNLGSSSDNRLEERYPDANSIYLSESNQAPSDYANPHNNREQNLLGDSDGHISYTSQFIIVHAAAAPSRRILFKSRGVHDFDFAFLPPSKSDDITEQNNFILNKIN